MDSHEKREVTSAQSGTSKRRAAREPRASRERRNEDSTATSTRRFAPFEIDDSTLEPRQPDDQRSGPQSGVADSGDAIAEDSDQKAFERSDTQSEHLPRD